VRVGSLYLQGELSNFQLIVIGFRKMNHQNHIVPNALQTAVTTKFA
jgi:hypothetical protein